MPRRPGQWVEITLEQALGLICKGASHKYLWKKKTATGWRYYYDVSHGGGIGQSAAEAEVGSAFRMRGADGKTGHYHVKSVDGDKVTIRHDETGETKTIGRDELRAQVHRHHAGAIVRQRNATLRELEAAKTGGTKAQRNRLTKRAVALGAKIDGADGSATKVFIAGPGGKPVAQGAKYRLVEAADIAPSHDPLKNFAKHPKYPEGVQERQYHRDKTHQQAVRENAQGLHPELLVNTNPDAVNGPPLVARDGVVLGGNSRTMSLQLAYEHHPESAARYRDYLAEHASHFGFDADHIRGMKAPILVRAVDDEGHDHATLVRRYNESFTQGMDPRTAMAAKARLVTDDVIKMLAVGMSENDKSGDPKHSTLSDFLGSTDSRGFMSALERSGVLDRRNREEFVNKRGLLNEDGKRHIERIMVGTVVDSEILPDVPTKQMEAIARSIPHIMSINSAGYDVKKPINEALTVQAYMRDHGLKTFAEFEADQGFGDVFSGAGFEKKPDLSPEGRTMLDAFIAKKGPIQMSGYFRDIATQAKRNPVGQAGFFGAPQGLADLLAEAGKPPQTDMFKGLGLHRAVMRLFAVAA